MKRSKVFFADFGVSLQENIPAKFTRLLRQAGLLDLPLSGKFVAIKTHFGERGNLAFLRPNYARALVDLVRESGGYPFLTDANTLYVGGRKNGLDHLETAYLNGFSPMTVGCHVLIADGLKGSDEVLVPIPDGRYVKEAKIGRAIMDADVLISLNHFKGHELTGFGGALKNVGMGSGSRAGKMEMHNAGKPHIDSSLCVACGACRRICAHEAPDIAKGRSRIDASRCVGCGRCIALCPVDAVQCNFDESNEILQAKIAEYAAAVLRGRPHFHVSVICDVSPNCDCHAENEQPILPNIGMAASADPVALDQACVDLCLAQRPMPGSCLEGHDGEDYFHLAHDVTRWQDAIEEGVRMGLGSRDYELVKI